MLNFQCKMTVKVTKGQICSGFTHYRSSGVASRKAMRGQPAPWYLITVIKFTQKANDPMWASQHMVLYYSFTVYKIATLTTWTFTYYVITAGFKFLFRN